MQASEPNINLQQITDILSVAATNGKKVGLSFMAGVSTPQWVYDAGALPFVLHSAGGGTLPMPWDTVYQAKFRNLIQAVGEAFDGHPNLDYVVMGGLGQQIDTTIVQFVDLAAANAAAQALGYANCAEGWLAGAQVITGFFASYFPTTPLIASISRVATKNLDNDENVSSYVGTTALQYGDRIGYMTSQLSSTSDATIVFNTLVRDNSPLHPAGFQFANASATTVEFQDTLTAGIALKMKWVEPYPANYNSSDPDQITAMQDAVTAMALLP